MCRSRRISRTASIRIWSPSGSSTYRSGCERRSTRGSPPSSSDANASAVARLPTPAGPWKRYACAGPSPSAARRSRFASSCSGTLSKLVEHLLRDLARRARAVDRRDPLGEDLGELAVGGVDPRAEVVVLALDPVALGADAPRRLGRVDEQQEGAVGQDAARPRAGSARARGRARARARSPGRRATSRGSGRRPRRRRARARARSPSSTSCARAAAKSAASAQGETSPSPSSSSRNRSPSSVPPGSRVATTSRPSPASASASSLAWVDLPEPSSPSNVTNTRA